MYNGYMSRIDIENLHKVTEKEMDALFSTLKSAFASYPKLDGAFPDPAEKAAAFEMVIEYYGRFDMKYGTFYSLDENITEGIAVLDSNEEYSEEKMREAGCESSRFCSLREQLGSEAAQRWYDFCDELDRQESLLDLPDEYIYVDFLAVSPDKQGCGRGRRLIEAVCQKADEEKLPVMLFTNGEKDVQFYINRGFEIAGITECERLGMKNVYMLYDNRKNT